MATRVKIRGIYSTALTKLVLDGGYCVVEPSSKIRERFSLLEVEAPPEIVVQERDDLQGIDLTGTPEKVCQFFTFLQERLFDAVMLECEALEKPEGLARARIEFPGTAKKILDEIRLTVAPTLLRHHRLRIVNSKALETVEINLVKHPDNKDSLERLLFLETILMPLHKAGVVRMEHIRPSGKQIRPREGVVTDADDEGVIFKRLFSEGRYDGLDLPIERGDYGLTEVHEGRWYVRHSYYSKQGELKGEYYNINTPIELYPYGARYLDLEVDVIRRSGENPFLADREKLAFLAREGRIGAPLEARAMEVAEGLLQSLRC